MAKKIESTIISAPFSERESKKLNALQKNGMHHGYTCCSPESIAECERRSGKNTGLLVVKNGVWVCPCGKYKQFWAHKADAK